MEYVGSILIQIGIFTILATSFNLIIGYGGLMSIAHPIFFALGAYGSGLIVQATGVPVPVGIAFGMSLATLASIALALPSLRVSGDYLVIASIGFQLGVLQIIKNSDWSGGPGGLTNIPPLIATVGSTAIWSYVAIVAVAALASILVVRWLVSGDYGRAITAMRDDEEAFKGLGHDPVRLKLVLFAIGSGLAGLAGGLYGHYFLFVTPEQFEVLYSAAMLTMVVVGGIRTVWGPALGAVLLQFMPQAIHFLKLPSSVTGPLQGILFTGLVLLFLFLRPHGLLGQAPGTRTIVQEDDSTEARVS
ncbi:MAG: branched-chain amino acid ABC transporter permease [Burkholderiales bacterium]